MKTATNKMNKIQSIKASFKFRLGAMLAMSPVQVNAVKVKPPIKVVKKNQGRAVFAIDPIGYAMGSKF